ncbi:MAG TPA: hypothetical protein VL328_18735 [Gemmatimonadaceae bacterium]|nr:hypothetical protein [Gemmatimonadaceae bacterium]
MRTDLKVATFSLALLLAACGTEKQQASTLSDDLQKDLAVAAAPAPGLATAPTSYEKMQVVSAVERTRAAAPAKRHVATKKRTPPVKRPEPVSEPAADVVEEQTASTSEVAPAAAPAAEPETTAPAPQPDVIAQQPASEPSADPAPAPVGRGGNEGDTGIGAGRSGGGLGGILGGIIGAVVIRGGIGGVDKCDPRTDGRRRRGRGGIIGGYPIAGMPLPTGTTPFPRAR